jgi:hypothetical protein
MPFSLLADAVVLVHLAFVLFVILGGLLVIRHPRVAWLHAPAVMWAVLLELCGWICPLTPLEKALRLRAGEAAYGAGFAGRDRRRPGRGQCRDLRVAAAT